MSRLDFHLEFQCEIPQIRAKLEAKTDGRLQALAQGYPDLIGAAVAVKALPHDETVHLYQARVVAYAKPDNIAAVEKADTPFAALRQALEAVERQLRQRRETFRKPWEKPENVQASDIYELTPGEVFETFVNQLDVQSIADLDRDAVASQLMLKEKLNEETAYYAADQLLSFAEQNEEYVKNLV